MKKEEKIAKLIVSLLFLLLSINIVLASSVPIYVKPLSSDGSLNPDETYSYTFYWTTDIACGNVVFSSAATITTGEDGVGFVNLTIPDNLAQLPNYLCEYREGTLRKVHALSSQLFEKVYAQKINATGNIYSSGIFYGDGSGLTNINAALLGSHNANFFMPLNKSVSGDFDFNSGWTSGGLSIIGGDLYAQEIHTYTMSNLNVSTLNINGSLTPEAGFDNQFDLGSPSLRWNDIFIGGDLHSDGDIYENGNLLSDTYYSKLNPFSFYNSTTIPDYALSSALSNYYLASNPSSYVSNSTMNKSMSCASIIGGSDSDFCVDATASGGSGITWVEAVNGTLFKTSSFNANYSANDAAYRSATNTSYYLTTNPFGYYNSTTMPGGSDSFSGGNYSTFLTHITWANAVNGTLAKTNAANTFGAFNQSFDTNSLFIDSVSHRIGIGTTAPLSTLSVGGEGVANTGIYGLGSSYGLYGASDFIGVHGEGEIGLEGESSYSEGIGVYGLGDIGVQAEGGNYDFYANSGADNYFAGNIGIGTLTPQNPLNVIGDANITGNLYVNEVLIGGSSGISWANAMNGTLMSQVTFNTNYSTNDQPYRSFVANYSTFLTKINWANAVNGTLFTTALYNTNYTTNDAAYRSATNISYYLATNPFGFYNSTTLPATNEVLWNANYSTFLTKINWANAANGTLLSAALFNTNYTTNDALYRSMTNTSYYLTTNPFLFYNSTTIPAYSTWANVVNGTVYLSSNPSNYLTNSTMNKSVSCSSITGGPDTDFCTDATGAAGGGISWGEATNGTLMLAENWNATNTSYYLATNPFDFYNSTNPPPRSGSPAWKGALVAAYSDGDPQRVLDNMQNAGIICPTPTNIGTTTARISYFKLDTAITVNKIRWYGVAAVSAIYHVAIYRDSDSARLTDDLEITTAAATWGSATTSVTLEADTLYFIAVSADTTGTTAGIASMGATTAATTGQIGVLPTSWPGNLDIDTANIIPPTGFAQFTVTAGALPATAGARAARSSWTGGMPVFLLDNNNA